MSLTPHRGESMDALVDSPKKSKWGVDVLFHIRLAKGLEKNPIAGDRKRPTAYCDVIVMY